jgi:hypothetical protein
VKQFQTTAATPASLSFASSTPSLSVSASSAAKSASGSICESLMALPSSSAPGTSTSATRGRCRCRCWEISWRAGGAQSCAVRRRHIRGKEDVSLGPLSPLPMCGDLSLRARPTRRFPFFLSSSRVALFAGFLFVTNKDRHLLQFPAPECFFCSFCDNSPTGAYISTRLGFIPLFLIQRVSVQRWALAVRPRCICPLPTDLARTRHLIPVVCLPLCPRKPFSRWSLRFSRTLFIYSNIRARTHTPMPSIHPCA